MAAEFDEYTKNYEDLLRDPLRDRFSRSGDFFHLRKWLLLEAWGEARKLDFSEMAWLDVGCGRGDLLRLGHKRFRQAAGCDVAAAMMPTDGGIDWRTQESALELPYAAESFDLITAVCVLHHVRDEDRLALVAAMAKTLKRDGWLCIIEHNPFNPVTRTIVRRSPVDKDAELLTAGAARSIATSVGLSATSTEYFLMLPERLFFSLRALEGLCCRVPIGGQYATFFRKRPAERSK